jgi:hypothetical protein
MYSPITPNSPFFELENKAKYVSDRIIVMNEDVPDVDKEILGKITKENGQFFTRFE